MTLNELSNASGLTVSTILFCFVFILPSFSYFDIFHNLQRFWFDFIATHIGFYYNIIYYNHYHTESFH